MNFVIDPIARFWETVFSGMLVGPPVSGELMAWITLICGGISLIMFVDWVWDKIKPK